MTTAYQDDKHLAHRLYILMMEANRQLSETEKKDLGESDIPDNDPDINSTLQFIRRKNLVAKGQLNKHYQDEAAQILMQIESEYGNDMDSLISALSKEPESEKLVMMFRNFSNLTERDKKQVLIDNKLLAIMQKLKDKKNDAG